MVAKSFCCGVNIDKSKDFCRCCKKALGIFPCPGCCGVVHVRCFREECAKRASEQGPCEEERCEKRKIF